MHRAQVHGSDILLIGIEDHVPGDAVVLFDVGQRIVNARAIQAGLADRIQQRVHRVIGQRGKLLRLLVEAGFEALIEVEPLWIVARGVVGEDSLETLGGMACLGQQRRPQRAIGAEDALLHAQGAHLLENCRRLRFVGPQHDGVGARPADDPQLPREVRVAGHDTSAR